MKTEIIETIIETINDFNEDLSENDKISTDYDEALYGANSKLDSMGLVSFIVGLEQNLEEKFNKSISLADERAMSHNTNPFKSINILAEYIFNILN